MLTILNSKHGSILVRTRNHMKYIQYIKCSTNITTSTTTSASTSEASSNNTVNTTLNHKLMKKNLNSVLKHDKYIYGSNNNGMKINSNNNNDSTTNKYNIQNLNQNHENEISIFNQYGLSSKVVNSLHQKGNFIQVVIAIFYVCTWSYISIYLSIYVHTLSIYLSLYICRYIQPYNYTTDYNTHVIATPH